MVVLGKAQFWYSVDAVWICRKRVPWPLALLIWVDRVRLGSAGMSTSWCTMRYIIVNRATFQRLCKVNQFSNIVVTLFICYKSSYPTLYHLDLLVVCFCERSPWCESILQCRSHESLVGCTFSCLCCTFYVYFKKCHGGISDVISMLSPMTGRYWWWVLGTLHQSALRAFGYVWSNLSKLVVVCLIRRTSHFSALKAKCHFCSNCWNLSRSCCSSR